jgi:NAD+ kinase
VDITSEATPTPAGLRPGIHTMASHYTHPILSPPKSTLQTVLEGEGRPSPTDNDTSSAGKSAEAMTVKPAELGSSMLRGYASHLDPLQSNGEIHQDHQAEHFSSLSSPATSRLEAHKETTAPSSLTSSTSNSIRPPKSFLSHRKHARSAEIPRQTIMKALASRPPGSTNTSLPLAASLTGLLGSPDIDKEPKPSTLSSQRLSTALASLQSTAFTERSPPSDRFPLQSPCFFHQRFDDAVNIDKVLEDVADDEWLSHSRLMQTATGVREVSKQLQRRPIKRAVRNIMIVTRARDHRLVYLTRELAEWLLATPRYGEDVGINVYVDAKLRNSKRFDAAGLVQRDSRFQRMLKYWTPDLCWTSPEKFDLVLTLGGDGTVLFTSWLFQRVVPPILSFALGSLGFLTNFEFDKYRDHLDRIMGDGGMRVNLRMRFTCTVWRVDRSPGADRGAVDEREQFEVLNELVIDRGPSPYVSNLELYGDNELLTVVQADGCIFSTPTGSTAYSLSAGGSLIHPSIPAILLTPICPHTLSFRPMVLSDTLALKIAVPSASRSTAYCSFDGKGRIELKQGDHVTLEASQYPFPTVMRGGNEWVDSVQRALRWNVRGAVQKGWGGSGGEEGEGEGEKWDIDTDPGPSAVGTDSGIGSSEDGSPASRTGTGTGTGSGSPMRRQMSLLNM